MNFHEALDAFLDGKMSLGGIGPARRIEAGTGETNEDLARREAREPDPKGRAQGDKA